MLELARLGLDPAARLRVQVLRESRPARFAAALVDEATPAIHKVKFGPLFAFPLVQPFVAPVGLLCCVLAFIRLLGSVGVGRVGMGSVGVGSVGVVCVGVGCVGVGSVGVGCVGVGSVDVYGGDLDAPLS